MYKLVKALPVAYYGMLSTGFSVAMAPHCAVKAI